MGCTATGAYGLEASESEGAVVLTWKLPAGWPGWSTFQVLRNRPEFGETEPLVHVQYYRWRTNTYTDTFVEPGVLYVYRVKGVDYFGSTERRPGRLRSGLRSRLATSSPWCSQATLRPRVPLP